MQGILLLRRRLIKTIEDRYILVTSPSISLASRSSADAGRVIETNNTRQNAVLRFLVIALSNNIFIGNHLTLTRKISISIPHFHSIILVNQNSLCTQIKRLVQSTAIFLFQLKSREINR